jgi:hypothetical protein
MLRTYSQIPVRAKYLLAVTDASGGNTTDIISSNVKAFTTAPGEYAYINAISTIEDISAAAGVAVYDISAGDMFKDLGRQTTVYDDADHKHLAVYRQVQKVEGADTEGVCAAADRCATIYVKVWSADGNGVVVVRTG